MPRKKPKKPPKQRFSVEINEGAWFYEPWLIDAVENQHYRFDKVPLQIGKLFAQQLRSRQEATPDEFRMILEIILHAKA